MTDDQMFGETDWTTEKERWVQKVDLLERFIESNGLVKEFRRWKNEQVNPSK